MKIPDEQSRQDVLQLALQILSAKGNPAQVLETLLSRLNAQIYAIGGERFAGINGVISFKTPADLQAHMKKLTGKASSREHTVFLVSKEVSESADWAKGLETLQTEGYKGIIRYTGEDTAKSVEPVFRLSQVAAWLSVSQFELLMRQDYGLQGREKGYLNAAIYLASKVIQTLIGEITSQQQVATAA